METLPTELHSQVFQLACTDDGTTARSLSLVSHYVRDVTRPYLYQSLAVAGLDSLTLLADKLEAMPPHMRRVRNLFLSDWTLDQTRRESFPFDQLAMDRFDLEGSTIIRILNLVASSLENLTILISCPYNGTHVVGHLFSLTLPKLLDLTINAFYPFPHVPSSMPRLERLHLAGNRNPHGLLQTGGLTAACPKLTHLKVSGLVSACSFAEELEEAARFGHNHRNESLTGDKGAWVLPSSFPKHIQYVLIQPGTEPGPGRRYRSTRLSHEKMLSRLEEVESYMKEEQDVLCKIVKGQGNEDVYLTRHQEWEERLRGEEGIWAA